MHEGDDAVTAYQSGMGSLLVLEVNVYEYLLNIGLLLSIRQRYMQHHKMTKEYSIIKTLITPKQTVYNIKLLVKIISGIMQLKVMTFRPECDTMVSVWWQ